MKTVIEMQGIKKYYDMAEFVVKALRGIGLTVSQGEFVAIMGASGSGKSTLMNIMGCLDRPTSGDYYFEGTNINALTRDEYATIRNQKIGFVFQVFNLLPRTSAVENVELPLFYDRSGRSANPKQEAIQALERVGLSDRIGHKPNQLSGGERQRVAIARALVNHPSIVLADEPTGNLDSLTSIDVMTLFQELNEQGITIVLVTHEPAIAQYAKRIITLRDGMITQDNAIRKRRKATDDLQQLQRENRQIQKEESIRL
jgi:putative ABC transport system ATP-binding protein